MSKSELEIRTEIIDKIEKMRNRTAQLNPGRNYEYRESIVQGDVLLHIWSDIKMVNEKVDQLLTNDLERD